MSRRFSFSLALVAVAGAAVALLLLLLPTEDARAPEQTAPEAQAVQAAEVQTGAVQTEAVGVNVADGFQDRNFADVPGATALAFIPDDPGDRLLVTDRRGFVRVHKPGSTNTTVALDISNAVCPNSERGLLGVAVDPSFQNNGYVYLYYTYNKFGSCPEKAPEQNNPVNRVSRFKMVGDDIVRASEDVLINNIPSPNGNHNAGDLHFGKDDKLYVSTGDGACNFAAPTKCQPENEASRYRNVLLGKILRINADGTIPADNPYAGNPDGVRCGTLTENNARGGSAAAPEKVCKETFAMGFRNPFRFAVDPDAPGTSLRVNDVGGARIEEVSQVKSGGDYGWNCREGTLMLNTSAPCPGNDMIGPIHQYAHNTGCSSITGAAFVPNNAGWPSSYRDAYLYGDYVCGKIYALKPNDRSGVSRTVFADGLQGGPVSFAFGPDGALYYTTYSGGGQVRRVAFVDNKAPVADVKVTPTDPETGKTFGPTPLTVNFDASGSNDPENDALTFEWDFGDAGSANNTATGFTANHTYDSKGTYTATLTVTDVQGNSDSAKVTVYAGNAAPPQPVIGSPVPGATFEVGQRITLSGSATDEDGQPVSLDWEVIRHHTAPNEHTHPSILDPAGSTGNSVSFLAPGPEDLRSTNPAGNYLEVRLTATDSQGLSKTVSRALKPETTSVRFGTRPAEFYLSLNGSRFKAPRTVLSWEGYELSVYAPSQMHDGRRYVFRSWSDGRGNRHTIVTPQDAQRYTATFRQR